MNPIVEHYDLLIDENNDPVRDPKELQEYMNRWDGQVFIDKMKLNTDKSVLEIGVGTGRLAIRTAPLCKNFVGIDISPKTADRARENLSEQSNATILLGDFLTFDFDEQFDVIYSSLTFMHIEDKQKAIDKVTSLLKKGGLFVLSTDKNQASFIDMGTRKIPVFPDNPEKIKTCIDIAGLILAERVETDAAHIFVATRS